jgi:hypothetical protein
MEEFFMDFNLTKEQADIQKAAREFAAGEFDPDTILEYDRDQKFPVSIWKKACDLGFQGVHFPEAYGGQGLGLLDHALIIEAFSEVVPPSKEMKGLLGQHALYDMSAITIPELPEYREEAGKEFGIRRLGARTVTVNHLEACFPYTAIDSTCSNACANWQGQTDKITGWHRPTVTTTLIEAMSGFAAMVGDPAGPPTLPPFPLADSFAALYGLYAAMFAIYYRDVVGNGKGQVLVGEGAGCS